MSHYANLVKGQDEETYKKYASKGMDLIFPVSVNGKTNRPDIGVRYHNSIKILDPEKDNAEQVHEKANKLDLTPPDAKEVGIEPAIIEGRDGYKMHVFRLRGPHAEKIKEHNKHFEGHGYKQNYTFHPHITVDKATWDKVKSSGAKTAHEAGIKFEPAELRHGSNILSRYHAGKLAANEDMQKGTIRNAAAALGIVGALASASHATAKSPHEHKQPASHISVPSYNSKRMLGAISSVESSSGHDINHKKLSGIHSGESAYGKYGLTPVVIRETVHMNPDLKSKHAKIMNLKGNDLHRYMHDNPGLEDAIANKHLSRLEHHFGKNPEKIGYAWLNGIRGTYKASKEKQNIHDHWHVKKIRDAYSKGK